MVCGLGLRVSFSSLKGFACNTMGLKRLNTLVMLLIQQDFKPCSKQLETLNWEISDLSEFKTTGNSELGNLRLE
jgi:hypothetical protein